MPQSLANVIIHIAFSTKNRQRFITPAIQPEISSFIATAARDFDCPAIRVESLEDHIHMVVSMSRKRSLSDLVERTKTSSSRWIKTKGEEFSEFQWQRGYGAFSVSPDLLQRVIGYLGKQQVRHRRISFQDELREFFRKSGIEFDERYVWD